MISAGHHTMMGPAGAPSVLSFLCFKPIAQRELRGLASYSAFDAHTSGQQMFQLSELQFIDENDSRFVYPSDMTYEIRSAWDGAHMTTRPIAVSLYDSGENIGRMFDGSTSTKWGTTRYFGGNQYTNIYDADTGDVVYDYDNRSSYDTAWWRTNFGNGCGMYSPIGVVLDVSSSPLDLTIYSRWQLLNANDNASQTGRTIVEAEILGSGDGKSWWRLDVFNNLNVTNANYAVVHTGNLIPRKGDIWSDLDLTTRDWANGIAVDNI